MSELIPPAHYPAVAVPVEGEDGVHLVRWSMASNERKTKQVLLYFQIIDGPHKGARLPWFGHFTKESYERTLQALRYCGWVGDDLTNLGSLDNEVSILVEHNTYNEKTHARVAFVNRPGGGAIRLKDPMGPDAVRAFAAQMKNAANRVAPVTDGRRVDRGAPAGMQAAQASQQRAQAPQSQRQPDMPGRDDWGPPPASWGQPQGQGQQRASGPPPSQQPPGGREPGSDDDIPF